MNPDNSDTIGAGAPADVCTECGVHRDAMTGPCTANPDRYADGAHVWPMPYPIQPADTGAVIIPRIARHSWGTTSDGVDVIAEWHGVSATITYRPRSNGTAHPASHVCQACGADVADAGTHTRFHAALSAPSNA